MAARLGLVLYVTAVSVLALSAGRALLARPTGRIGAAAFVLLGAGAWALVTHRFRWALGAMSGAVALYAAAAAAGRFGHPRWRLGHWVIGWIGWLGAILSVWAL